MTELLYFEDSYRRDFDAVVQAIEAERIRLERTAFYPTGGGQPHDLGWLAGTRRRLAVTEVRKSGDDVWHTLPGHDFTVGEAVHGSLDWERRYQLMRTHTAMHILSAVIWRDHDAQVTGGGMEPLKGRMDFELDSMRTDFATAIETAVNAEIAANRRIEVRLLPRQEAERIPDLVRTKVNLLPPALTTIRIVHIEGLDLQADGGTHVHRTGEVGAVRVIDSRSKGKANKRLVIAVTDA